MSVLKNVFLIKGITETHDDLTDDDNAIVDNNNADDVVQNTDDSINEVEIDEDIADEGNDPNENTFRPRSAGI